VEFCSCIVFSVLLFCPLLLFHTKEERSAIMIKNSPTAPSRAVSGAAALQLQKELKDIMTDRLNDYCKVDLQNDNIFEWNVYILGPPGTDYEGGIFKTHLSFPRDYPFEPPVMRFLSEFWHPNVYADGKVCISILHTPDPMNPDENGQNWTPAQRVESLILSVISMLSDPNFSSPANVDASVELRKEPATYKARLKKLIEKARKELPLGFEMPKVKAPVKITESFELPLSDDEVDDFGEDGDEEELLDDDDDADDDDDDDDNEGPSSNAKKPMTSASSSSRPLKPIATSPASKQQAPPAAAADVPQK